MNWLKTDLEQTTPFMGKLAMDTMSGLDFFPYKAIKEKLHWRPFAWKNPWKNPIPMDPNTVWEGTEPSKL